MANWIYVNEILLYRRSHVRPIDVTRLRSPVLMGYVVRLRLALALLCKWALWHD
jgi:hypothetical protein